MSDASRADAMARLDRLTKPVGALGRLEALAAQLADIADCCPPPMPAPAAVAVFAGDHGVWSEGVSPWPQAVTAQMVANFTAGGAAINVIARQVGASVTVVDVGVATPCASAAGLIEANVRRGTRNLVCAAAMTDAECAQALAVGAEVAGNLISGGARLLVTGDMGIANTTPSAALIAAYTGSKASAVTGRGTGIDDETLARKTAVVERALSRLAHTHPSPSPTTVLAELGGLEIAALAGFILAAATGRIPVVIDGVIALAAAVAAAEIDPSAKKVMIAGHRSTEPGAGIALAHLGLRPLLDLDLRLGEGTGACLAVPIVQTAARILHEMATFDDAGVTEK